MRARGGSRHQGGGQDQRVRRLPLCVGLNDGGDRRRRRCKTTRHHQRAEAICERSPAGLRDMGWDRRLIYCAMRGKTPYFVFSERRRSEAIAGLARNACATSMIGGFSGPSDPARDFDPVGRFRLRRRGRQRRKAGRRGLAAREGFQLSPPQTIRWRLGNLVAESSQGLRRSRIATPPAVPIVGRLRPGSSAARNRTERLIRFFPQRSVGALRSERLRVVNQSCPSQFSIARSKRSFLILPDAGGASLPSHFWP